MDEFYDIRKREVSEEEPKKEATPPEPVIPSKEMEQYKRPPIPYA
jgi:hypothetical protein